MGRWPYLGFYWRAKALIQQTQVTENLGTGWLESAFSLVTHDDAITAWSPNVWVALTSTVAATQDRPIAKITVLLLEVVKPALNARKTCRKTCITSLKPPKTRAHADEATVRNGTKVPTLETYATSIEDPLPKRNARKVANYQTSKRKHWLKHFLNSLSEIYQWHNS